MSSPHRSYCHRAGNIFRAGNIYRTGKIFRAGNPLRTGNPRIRPPGLRNPPGTVPTDPAGLSLAIPEWVATHLPRKGGYPRIRGGLSLLPRIFRRHQHLPLGCQPRSPECSKYFQLTTMRSRRTLPDSVGFPTGLPSDRMGLFRQDPLLTQIY